MKMFWDRTATSAVESETDGLGGTWDKSLDVTMLNKHE
jgi:hypothetical protein